jgi:hypothetical protein
MYNVAARRVAAKRARGWTSIRLDSCMLETVKFFEANISASCEPVESIS